ncbi:MAG: Holliday junction branch migration protein RuvA [Treponema sp.]|nr:Holliday junction branch migration protein RuvA [Treponema sp.]MCL2252395.1 Holliday junction branch migration protein RuvA [Treponema sp.]
MFNSIRGIVSAKGAEAVFLLCNDIEWEITMPANDMYSLPLNDECRILTWLYHREDQMKLFGFIDDKRRNTFLELIKVEGIGPKAAVKIMGGITQDDLEKALDNADLNRLEAVPGLGKKTAQKMVLALKGKLVSAQDKAIPSAYNDLVEALVGMGYDRRQANEAIKKAEDLIADGLKEAEKEKILFKEAIIYLSGV